MKSPVWILNSTLAIFIFASLVYILFSFSITFNHKNIKNHTAKPIFQRHGVDQGFLKTIYEDNDLFNTYVEKTALPPTPVVPKIQAPPAPPSIQELTPVATPAVTFLEPLNIKISGIIMSTNDFDSRIIIQENSTKIEALYKLGDKVEDANILRILQDKVIFLRSNGQQDTLYITTAQAEHGFKEASGSQWTNIIKSISNNTYTVNKDQFAKKINSLGQFIGLLDFITAFKDGESIGVRIGNVQDVNLVNCLGLQPNDIILKIDDIEPNNTAKRLDIYNKVILKNPGDSIPVEILRNANAVKITYVVENLEKETENLNTQKHISELPANEPIDINKFGPLVNDMKKNDRQSMLKNGKKSILQDITN